MRLREKVAIVTGGSSGIGRATCLALAREGANVVVVSRNQKEIESVAKEIKALKVKALSVKTDVSSFKDVNLLVEKTMKESAEAVWQRKEKYQTDLRRGAFILALERLEQSRPI